MHLPFVFTVLKVGTKLLYCRLQMLVNACVSTYRDTVGLNTIV